MFGDRQDATAQGAMPSRLARILVKVPETPRKHAEPTRHGMLSPCCASVRFASTGAAKAWHPTLTLCQPDQEPRRTNRPRARLARVAAQRRAAYSQTL